jgi:hypothetical protein
MCRFPVRQHLPVLRRCQPQDLATPRHSRWVSGVLEIGWLVRAGGQASGAIVSSDWFGSGW